jgi:hypothetical protein
VSRHNHYWMTTGIPHPLVFLNGKFLYECSVCDKRKYFRHQPVNPLVPSAWEVYDQEVQNGNAAYVMSPPLQVGQEEQWSEGQRYKNLVEGHKL